MTTQILGANTQAGYGLLIFLEKVNPIQSWFINVPIG